MGSEPSQRRSAEQKTREGYLAGAAMLLALSFLAYPQLLGAAAIAGVLVAVGPPLDERPVGRSRRRRVAWWEIAWGLSVGSAYLLMCAAALGLQAQSDRFEAAWRDGLHLHPAAFIDYPWGWAPPALALALVAAGAFNLWRAR